MLDTVVWLNWRGLEGAQYAHVSVRVIRWTTQGSHLGAVSVLRGCCCVCCQHGIVVHIPGTCAVKTTGQTTTQEVDQHAVAYYEQPNAICEGLTPNSQRKVGALLSQQAHNQTTVGGTTLSPTPKRGMGKEGS